MKNNQNNKRFKSNNTVKSFFWEQTYTRGVNFESEVYCIEPNHYITKPNLDTCEICNAIIKERQ